MIIPDINLLLYAYDAASPFHAEAVARWQACLSGGEPVGLPQVVVFGFVSVSTNAGVFQHPLTPTEAVGHVRNWQRQLVIRLSHAAISHPCVLKPCPEDVSEKSRSTSKRFASSAASSGGEAFESHSAGKALAEGRSILQAAGECKRSAARMARS